MKPHSFAAFTVAYTLLIVGILVLLWWAPSLSVGDWAAWVQAVGSVLAIVAAAWIAANDRHEQNRLRLIDELEGTAVVFEQGYWLATRIILKLPQRLDRRTEARLSWKRVKPQWIDAVGHIRKLSPILPEQFNAQLIVAARLRRMINLYKGALHDDLGLMSLLDLDKAAGRVMREVLQLRVPLSLRGARGPLYGVEADLIDHLCLQIDTTLAAFATDQLAKQFPTYFLSQDLLDDFDALMSRRWSSLDQLNSSQSSETLHIKRELAAALGVASHFVSAARNDPAIYRLTPSPFDDLPGKFEALRLRALALPIPNDHGA